MLQNPSYWRETWPCYVTLILFFILSIVPLNFFPFESARPLFMVIGIYYWALFREDFLNIAVLFVIGLCHDALLNLPLGYTSIVLIALHLLVGYQRAVLLRQPFGIIWIVFVLLMAILSCCLWATASLITGHLLAIGPYILEYLMTVFIFPPLVLLLRLGNTPLNVHVRKK